MDMQEYIGDFLVEANNAMNVIESSIATLEQDPTNSDALNEMHRHFHSLKSASAMMGLTDISEHSKAMELLVEPFAKDNSPIAAEALQTVKEQKAVIASLIGNLKQ